MDSDAMKMRVRNGTKAAGVASSIDENGNEEILMAQMGKKQQLKVWISHSLPVSDIRASIDQV